MPGRTGRLAAGAWAGVLVALVGTAVVTGAGEGGNVPTAAEPSAEAAAAASGMASEDSSLTARIDRPTILLVEPRPASGVAPGRMVVRGAILGDAAEVMLFVRDHRGHVLDAVSASTRHHAGDVRSANRFRAVVRLPGRAGAGPVRLVVIAFDAGGQPVAVLSRSLDIVARPGPAIDTGSGGVRLLGEDGAMGILGA